MKARIRPALAWFSAFGATRRAAWAVFALALGMRLALGFAMLDPVSPPLADGYHYDALARSIVERGVLATDGEPTAHRMPGYPLFLAAIRVVLGPEPVNARLVQAVVGSVTAVLVMFLGRVLFGPAAGLLAGIAAALDPFLIYYDFRLWSECLSIFHITAILLIYATLVRRPSIPLSLLGGLTAATAIQVRPDLLLLVAAVGLWLPIGMRSLRRAIPHGLILGLIPVLLLVPWWVRCYRVFGSFIPLTTEGAFILWQTNNEETMYEPELAGLWVPWPGGPVGHTHADYLAGPDLKRDPRFAGLETEVEIDHKMREIVHAFWREHASEMPRYVLNKWKRFFQLSPSFAFWPQTFVWVSRVWYGTLFALYYLAIGLLIRGPTRPLGIGLLVSYTVWIFVKGAAFLMILRYRLQYEMVFLVLAGFSAWWLAERVLGAPPSPPAEVTPQAS